MKEDDKRCLKLTLTETTNIPEIWSAAWDQDSPHSGRSGPDHQDQGQGSWSGVSASCHLPITHIGSSVPAVWNGNCNENNIQNMFDLYFFMLVLQEVCCCWGGTDSGCLWLYLFTIFAVSCSFLCFIGDSLSMTVIILRTNNNCLRLILVINTQSQ